jgi:hypothetical protein
LCLAQLPTSTAFRSSISGLATKRLTSTLSDIINYFESQGRLRLKIMQSAEAKMRRSGRNLINLGEVSKLSTVFTIKSNVIRSLDDTLEILLPRTGSDYGSGCSFTYQNVIAREWSGHFENLHRSLWQRLHETSIGRISFFSRHFFIA